RGRLDASIHPFCSGFGTGDVRITWRYDRGDLRPGLFGILHEAGHGMYEQGLPADWERTPLGPARSMGVHESQSRLWENHVGRHPGFWRHALPELQRHFPAWSGSVDELCPAFHKIEPSLIRVEADEVTYNLHILIRFRLELALVTGELAVADLESAWDGAYEELLGIRPDRPSRGVLQDIHWAEGLFGYFPTYTLGSLLSAQLFEASEADLGDHGETFARGEFAPLLDWLRERIHRHGSYYTAGELTEAATGTPLASDAFLRYVGDKLATYYGIAAPSGDD
ncbi:MAG: carboxypeptidase M32, partial [Thermoanaerobaculia bacterium]|nr:carboxypeptidase M32 [Thermoanaerobaculia bacterium]